MIPAQHDIILVTPEDVAIGTASKSHTHRTGLLHRAFSILIFDTQGRMLLQQRAKQKYHSGGLWTNACCSHPRPEELISDAAHRRLQEELAFDCPLAYQYKFIYKAELDNGLIEHELDYVFTGLYEGIITPNPNEVQAYQYMDIAQITEQLRTHPEHYTAWFRIIFEQYSTHTKENIK